MKLDITKISLSKPDPQNPDLKIQTKGMKIRGFRECSFPTHRWLNKETSYDNCPEGYRDAFPWCSISEDGNEVHVHESASETRVYRVGEEMPINYYAAFLRQIAVCQARIELFDPNDVIVGAWSGDSEEEVAVVATKIGK